MELAPKSTGGKWESALKDDMVMKMGILPFFYLFLYYLVIILELWLNFLNKLSDSKTQQEPPVEVNKLFTTF